MITNKKNQAINKCTKCSKCCTDGIHSNQKYKKCSC